MKTTFINIYDKNGDKIHKKRTVQRTVLTDCRKTKKFAINKNVIAIT